MRVIPSGTVSFRLDYRLNGRREIVYLGKYGRDGISLAHARELCLDTKRFGEFGEKWLTAAPMADSTLKTTQQIDHALKFLKSVEYADPKSPLFYPALR